MREFITGTSRCDINSKIQVDGSKKLPSNFHFFDLKYDLNNNMVYAVVNGGYHRVHMSDGYLMYDPNDDIFLQVSDDCFIIFNHDNEAYDHFLYAIKIFINKDTIVFKFREWYTSTSTSGTIPKNLYVSDGILYADEVALGYISHLIDF